MTETKFMDEFLDAFAHSGSIMITCRCGRLHVATNEIEYLESEDIEEIEELKRKSPDKVIEWDCDMISWTTINSEVVVFDCPCGYADFLCNFIEGYHEEIMKVIEKIIKSEKGVIDNKEELFRKVKEAK